MTKGNNQLIKLIGGGVLITILLITSLNSFTIVTTNSQASVESFGEVHQGKVLEGFNLVLPWWGIDEYSQQFVTENYEDLQIASQDKFKTNMDVSFTGYFEKGYADKLRASSGTAEQFLITHVGKRVLSCQTKAGLTVKTSQAFFDEATQVKMAEFTLSCVNNYIASIGGGYKIKTVQYSDIRLDPVVRGFMVETKKRQEGENQAKSDLQIADTNAQKLVKTSESRYKAAVNNKKAAALASEAIAYDMEQLAEGNRKLAKSVTPLLTSYIKAKAWNGALPTHVLGTNTSMFLK
jgi:regulator of protease activity HflC (stomatin/prohibitin superfamily)